MFKSEQYIDVVKHYTQLYSSVEGKLQTRTENSLSLSHTHLFVGVHGCVGEEGVFLDLCRCLVLVVGTAAAQSELWVPVDQLLWCVEHREMNVVEHRDSSVNVVGHRKTLVNVVKPLVNVAGYRIVRMSCWCVFYTQWNASNTDTNGTEESVLLVRCPYFGGCILWAEKGPF